MSFLFHIEIDDDAGCTGRASLTTATSDHGLVDLRVLRGSLTA